MQFIAIGESYMNSILNELNDITVELIIQRAKIDSSPDTQMYQFITKCVGEIDAIAAAYVIAPMQSNLHGKYQHTIARVCIFLQFIDDFKCTNNSDDVQNIVNFTTEQMNAIAYQIIEANE